MWQKNKIAELHTQIKATNRMEKSAKTAILLLDSLPFWKLNVTVFLATGIGDASSEAMGEKYRDSMGREYTRLFEQPFVVSAASKNVLVEAMSVGHEQGLRRMVMDIKIAGLIAKQEIREVLYRYARGIDRVDRDLVLSCFHSDAVCRYGTDTQTPAELTDWSMKHVLNFEVSQHRMNNIQIELLGSRANVETYLMAIHVLKDKRLEEVAFARLLDLFEERDGSWRIMNRLVVVDYSTTRERADPYRDEARHTRFARDKSDPVYTHKW